MVRMLVKVWFSIDLRKVRLTHKFPNAYFELASGIFR
jgi:hypothetical protein